MIEEVGSPLPADHKQRQSALDPEGSYLCEAPAGSGKTELLTQRVLTLLARVDKPEAVLAITFTRKASAEMRDRLLGALHAALGPAPNDAHRLVTWNLAQKVLQQDAHHQWQLLQNPNRLQIRTFDGLCRHLTQALPLQSALSAGVQVSDDAGALYREAVTALFETLEEAVPWADALAAVLMHLDNRYDRLQSLLVRMLANRDVWMPVLVNRLDEVQVRLALEQNLQQVLQDKVAQLHELIPADLHVPLLELASGAGAELLKAGVEDGRAVLAALGDVYELPGCEDDEMHYWRALVQLLLTNNGSWRVSFDKRCGFPAGTGKDEKAQCKAQKARMQALIGQLQTDPDLLSALQDVLFWPSASYAEPDWQILQDLTTLLPVLVAHLQLVFRAQGKVDFIEVSHRAGVALGDSEAPTDLALRLDYQIQHILVDEFQDTSFTQYNLLQKLTAGWHPGDGRTLFCVGDAMQSIYGFRGANVGLFLHCKYNGLGDIALTPLQLTTNFRSQAGIVDWVNSTFAHAFPEHNDITTGAVRLSRADAFKEQLPGDAVRTLILDAEQGAGGEAQAVVEAILATREQSPQDRIAILVRNRRHALGTVQALKQRRIAFRAVDLEALMDVPIIQDLASLTRALLYPGQRIAWFAVLRAPWCGLTLADCEAVSAQLNGHADCLVLAQALQACTMNVPAVDNSQGDLLAPDPVPRLSADGLQRLQRVLPVLQRAMQERLRKPLRAWIQGVWIQIGGPACLTAAHQQENVQRYFSLLESFDERGHIPGAEEFQRELDRLFAAPDPAADDRLQIMTIHKSKGLEFDTVILPGMHRLPRNQDAELLLWQERLTLGGDKQLLLAPLSATGCDRNPIYQHLAQEKKKREQFESARLLYVACTRAKKRLLLLTQLEDDEDAGFRAPSTSSLLAYIWPSVAQQAQRCSSATRQTGPGVKSKSAMQRLPENWNAPQLPEETLLQQFVPFFSFDNTGIAPHAYSRELLGRRAAGALLLECARRLGRQGLTAWQARPLCHYAPVWRVRLQASGVLVHELEPLLAQVTAQMEALLKHPQFIWLHSAPHQRLLELPVSQAGADGLVHTLVDVLAVDDAGSSWSVRYCVDQPEEGQSMEEFLATQIQRHKSNLRTARRSLQQLGYPNVKTALYFLALCLWQPC